MSGFGSTFKNVGTAANPTPTSTSFADLYWRATFRTANTAGSLASHRQRTLLVWRGNAPASVGSLHYPFWNEYARYGQPRVYCLTDSVAALTNVDPTTSGTIGRLGLAINSNTGNWKWVNNTTGYSANSNDLLAQHCRSTIQTSMN